VPNPSFEKLKAIPCSWVNEDDFRRIYEEWFQPTAGSTDVFSTLVDSSCYASCFSTYKNSNGFQSPRTGNVMTAILTAGYGCYVNNYREYLGVRLIKPLIPQKTYYAEMFVSRTDSSRHATNNIGMYFSPDSIALPRYCEYIGFQPQINSDNVIEENNDWIKISSYFKVSVTSQFLYIGNMFSQEETIIKEVNPKAQFNTRYFVDDVLVRPCLSVSPDTLICRGNSVTLRAWGSPVYGWADAKEPVIILSEDSVISISPNITTTYLAYSICDTLSVTITIPQQLKDTTICTGDSINISLKYTDTQNYDVGDSSIWLSETGEYIISRAFPNCIQTDAFTLSHKPLPILDLGSDTLICKIDTVILDVTEEQARFKWEDGSENPIRIITQPGTYDIEGWLDGCYNQNSINIRLEECEAELLMPNVFTPNNDQFNDLLTPISNEGIVEMDFQIFDRNGKKLFQTHNTLINWDGTHNKLDVPSGLYYWYLQYLDKNGNNGTLKGYLSLLR
jgi:gliding motility-associated-like protein